jgi:hydrogenase maturation protein HypF
MAEHGLLEPVVGVSLDGTGYGTDQTIWGGEFLWSNGAFFERLAHLEPVEMPGGDSLSTHPWKSALAYVLKYAPDYLQSGMPAFMGEQDLLLALEVLQRKINTHLSSSCGRLFDAVASLLNVCQHNAWQARAPVKLENLLNESVPGTYDWETKEQTLSFGPMIRGMLREYAEGKDRAIISTKFHRTLVEAFGEKALQCCRQTGLQKVVLSGGCFQNRFLLSKLKQYLTKQHIQVYTPQAAPANDGGIALGQLYTATLRRRSHVS